MKPVLHTLSAAVLAVMASASMASTTTYTSSGLFLPHLAAGSYTESFDGLSSPPSGTADFSSGGFAYTASAPTHGIYLDGGFLGSSQIDEAVNISFTSGNVKAIGANFFATNISDEFQSVSLSLLLSDGTSETFTPTSLADSYRGFVSDAFITSLTISGPGASLYAGLDNLTVGTTPSRTNVPEPTSVLLAGLGLAAAFVTRRRAD